MALGHTLIAVVRGRADESLLEKYEESRRAVAQRVVALTHRMTKMATLRSAHGRALRNAFIRMIFGVPAVPRGLATELAGLRNREAA